MKTETALGMKTDHASEVAEGRRFEFGKNWERFLRDLDDSRILAAEHSLQDMLEAKDLTGRTFLDIGSGSGLFSLAARRLGASVYSFDYDPASVACTRELKRRYFPQDPLWMVDTGSALDANFVGGLGQYDIVYSWGVLHHTGDMWRALENAAIPCKPGASLFIAIYNDQGSASRRWTSIKRMYNRASDPAKLLMVLLVCGYFVGKHAVRRATRLQNPLSRRRDKRGMSWYRDVVDWVGGYPFEVARPEQIIDFYRRLGFTQTRLNSVAPGHGCNEFVFRRSH